MRKLKANLLVRSASAALGALGALASVGASAQEGAPDGEWLTWGGDAGHTRYSALDQITLDNVDQLEVAWRWAVPPPGDRPASNFKSAPLMHAGVLYVPSGEFGASAVDAGTGETIWNYAPPAKDGEGGRGASLGSRALAMWIDGESVRLIHSTEDGRLISIDAATGEADPDFGEDGIVDLSLPASDGGEPLGVRVVSPAVVVGDVIVSSVIPGAVRDRDVAAPGFIRGYDARTGEQLWTFHTIPQEGEFGVETWENESWRISSAAGAWTMMTADPETGYVYIGTETANDDGSAGAEFYAGNRLGDNLFAESIVCLDSATGERVWHFQIVHHGIWDYDMPAAPILHDIVIDGETIPAVTQLTKQSMSFVFNRITGEPIWPIEEREVPQSTIEGERTSPTQPFVTRPEPYSILGYEEDMLIDFTPELRAEAIEIAEQYTRQGMYTPMTEIVEGGNQGTWIYPGYGGGSNWNAAAFDPDTHMMYVPIRHKVYTAGLTRGDPEITDLPWVRSGGGILGGPRGLPLLKPPYSELVMTDMDAGEHLWRVPTGAAPDFVQDHPDLRQLELNFEYMGQWDIRPVPLLTSEVLFLSDGSNISGTTGSEMFYALDPETGERVWQTALPSIGTGSPITYMHEDRQYVVIGVSSRDHPAELVALTLNGESEAENAPVGDLAAQDPDAGASATTITLTDAERAAGAAVFAANCQVCHGVNGVGVPGSNAPSLIGVVDYDFILDTVQNGAVEMPAMSLLMTEEDMLAAARYVAAGLEPE